MIINPSAPEDTLGQRTSQFQLGMTGGGPRATSLEQVSVREQSEVPHGFTPASILTAFQIPGYHPNNGNSSFDAARQTPTGQIPSPNAMSMNTWNGRNPSTLRTRLALR